MESRTTEQMKTIFLCNYGGCDSARFNWNYGGKLMYGSESSSAVEKHILNLHLKPFNPKIASNMNVAEAKRKFPEIVPQLKQLTVKVTPTDASYNQLKSIKATFPVPILSNNNNVHLSDSPTESPIGSERATPTLLNEEFEEETVVWNSASYYSNLIYKSDQSNLSPSPELSPNMEQVINLPQFAIDNMRLDESSDKKRRMEKQPEKPEQDELVASFTKLKVKELEVDHLIVNKTAQGVDAATNRANNLTNFVLQQLQDGPKTADELKIKWKEEFQDNDITKHDINVFCYQNLKGKVAPTADKPPKFKLM